MTNIAQLENPEPGFKARSPLVAQAHTPPQMKASKPAFPTPCVFMSLPSKISICLVYEAGTKNNNKLLKIRDNVHLGADSKSGDS